MTTNKLAADSLPSHARSARRQRPSRRVRWLPAQGPRQHGKNRGGRRDRSSNRQIVRRAIADCFRKLDPRHQVRNPVMFVVEVGSVLTTGLFVQALVGHGEAPAGFILAISAWLWFTVLFANFAEAMAEGRGKAQADSLRKARRTSRAKQAPEPRRSTAPNRVFASQLRKGDLVLVEAGDLHPGRRRDRSRASPRSTRAPSPARARRSSARAAATAAPSPAAPGCCPTGSSFASPPTPAKRSSTA